MNSCCNHWVQRTSSSYNLGLQRCGEPAVVYFRIVRGFNGVEDYWAACSNHKQILDREVTDGRRVQCVQVSQEEYEVAQVMQS